MERRLGVELRADGRTLVGAVVRWGDVSPSHRERFEAGSLKPGPGVVLNLGHDPMRALAYGDDLEIEDRDDALVARARLPLIPAADVALDGVKSGRYRGYSSEFRANRDSRDADGIRIVEDAILVGIGLVDAPSYHENTVEVRRRIGGVSSSIPKGRAMDCRCADGCTEALIEVDARIDISDTAIAIRRGYAEALASRSKRTLRVNIDNEEIRVDLDLPDTSYARDLLEAADNVPLIVRPVVDFDLSEWVKDGTLARFSRLAVPAFVIGFSDMSDGHQEAAASRRRKMWTL